MQHALRLLNLRKSFGPVTVFDGIDLAVAPGEVVSLIGASGSGKSTMLRCINFLEMPDSGTVEVFDKGLSVEAGGMTRGQLHQIREIRKITGMVFQNFNLWPHRTALGNVTEALIHVLGQDAPQARDTAMAALEKVGMAGFANRYPAQLSGGQQQRVGIARVLAMRPRVMLFDEATSALDPELVGEVLKVLRLLAQEGNTILQVTHEMRFAREVSDRMVFLSQGRILQDAPPEELFTNPADEAVKRFLSGTH
ncbi:amino acid ABC transporter ATP-binding protein [Rhodobacter sp. KR11]|uniref:amino acid ABC transporter ATP-binding protein n=1 Tax=Rhodobacter sp. KR11 TaxID=2974588 RepID=UPI0022219A98|nr:amino acid ABC transporter ATP-binding protein [Rhodobacter sp. KR11]MCW1920514.1 amino acid ABC transporter ATP-binding protein [Rhodobacter sp. KR11]